MLCSYPDKIKKKEPCEDVGHNVLQENMCGSSKEGIRLVH